MKKILVFTMLLLVSFFSVIPFVKANEIESTDYVNARGVRMTQEQYNLLKENYPEDAIKVMRQNIFDNLMTDINYYEFEQLPKVYIEETTRSDGNGNIVTTSREITKEEYDNFNPIQPASDCVYDGSSVCWETNAKILAVNVYASSAENYSEYDFWCYWKSIPKVKSYDVIASRLPSGFKLHYFDGIQFYHDSTGMNDQIDYKQNGSNSVQKSNGVGISMNIVDEATAPSGYEDLVMVLSIEGDYNKSPIYFSYQHATSDVTLAQSKDYTFSSSGMGGVIKFNSSSIASKYDDTKGLVYTP